MHKSVLSQLMMQQQHSGSILRFIFRTCMDRYTYKNGLGYLYERNNKIKIFSSQRLLCRKSPHRRTDTWVPQDRNAFR
ncbi:hypothetical protein H5410_037326 [Solanum commersonii]|uniref:Uncharacterized protein n=1 Tax=Solanum commersonii TaxID=4109 RepID=A0A9J5YAW7_SOLCO|nr:hypothetical protein H5410_037326 [Solanum commersonii]